MRTAYLDSVRHITLTTTPMPTLHAADQVIVQTKAVGICGSEVHAYQGTHPYRKAPTILGHEMAGVIVAAGEAVKGFRVGDRVIIDPQWPCGDCLYCRRGEINLCTSKKVLGTPAWPGAFAEYVLAPQSALFHLPEGLSFAQGSLVEPLTVAVHVVRRAGIQAGQSVLILGSGSIGTLLAGICRVSGADPIIVADIRQHCMDAARESLGASHDILLPDDDLVAKAREIAGGGGLDVVLVAADDVSLVARGVQALKRGGVLVLVALLTHAPLQLRAYDLIRKEITMLGSNMSDHDDVRRAIELATSRQVDVSAIHTHTLPIEQAGRGMELARTKDEGAIKVIMTYT